MFGINNPRLVEMRLARRRNMRTRWWRQLRGNPKAIKRFPYLRLCRHMNLRHKALPQGMKWLKLAWLRGEI